MHNQDEMLWGNGAKGELPIKKVLLLTVKDIGNSMTTAGGTEEQRPGTAIIDKRDYPLQTP